MSSEIRANTIKNRVGLGTIEYSNTGPIISGVTTALNFKTGTSNLHNTGLNVQDLDVDGHTNLDNISIAGVTTTTDNINIDADNKKLQIGDKVIASSKADIKPGNAMPLASVPVGTIVHNVELKPGKGGQLARSAGSYIQVIGRDLSYSILRLTSGEVRLVLSNCMCTVGSVSNPDNQNQNLGKAGRSRWLGKRPTVRGVAMNPIDHPHGGGEGRTSGGRHPVTPWGKPTKGKRTRNNKKTDRLIIRRRNK